MPAFRPPSSWRSPPHFPHHCHLQLTPLVGQHAAQQAEQLLHAGDDASAALDTLEQALARAIEAAAALTAQTPPGQPAMPMTK